MATPMIGDNDRKWWILAAMGGVMGILLLDETVVAVALHTVRNDLNMSLVASHWVINAYLLVFTCFAAAGGKLGDILGHRDLFLVSLAIFGIASAACGFAEDGNFLITARAVQGFGAAIIFPLSLAMITLSFPKEQRGFALGVYSAVGTLFLALGPFVGGLLIDILSWRWIFWINPFIVVVIALVVLAAWTEPARDGVREAIDYWGLVSLVAGLSMLVFAIMQGPEWGWSQPVIWVLLAAGILGLVVFVFIEHRTAVPLIAVNLFRGSTFSTSNLIIFTAQFNQMIIVVFGALYFQKVLNMSPLVAGAALLVAVGSAPITAAPTGRLIDRIGARPVALGGLALTVTALIWITVAVNFENYVLLIPGLIAWGSANCALYIAPRRAALNSVPLKKHGETGGVLMTSQLLGGTIGVAICGSLYAITDDFQVVFAATAILTTAVLAMTWLWLETEKIAEAKA